MSFYETSFFLLAWEADETMSKVKSDADRKSQREMCASAAERRISLSPNSPELFSENASNYEDQGTNSSFDVNLSKSLFGM